MRLWLHVLFAVVVIVGSAEAARAATNLTAMQPAEIEALQKRLTDDGCYSGPIDGQASDATNDAVKACPDQDPMLRIETGMHTAIIRRISGDRSCKIVATGSVDKTVRVWSMPDGRLLRTVRLPIDTKEGGRIDAIALSPDGRTLAVGGWDAAANRNKTWGHGLYVVDLVSGAMQRIGAFPISILQISFSRDGARIGVGLGGTGGLHVLDTNSGRELMVDHNYADSIYGLASGPDGALFTTSVDGFLRRYSSDLRLAAKVKSPDGTQPYEIAIDPSGKRVGVGYYDLPSVSLLDATSLKKLATFHQDAALNGDLLSVAWTSDGHELVAAGTATRLFDGQRKGFLRRFDAAGRLVADSEIDTTSMIVDLKTCNSGIVFATYDPRFGLMSPDGHVITLQEPLTADMREKVGLALAVSPDASVVRFGLGKGLEHPVLFDLARVR